MKIIVSGHHVNVTKPLKEYARKKFSKIDKYFENIKDIKIELNVLDTRVLNKRQEASVIVSCAGILIKAKQASQDMYASIDMVFEKVRKQLKKHKEKMKKRKKVRVPAKRMRVKEKGEKVKEPRVIKSKMFADKPMNTGEAIMQLKALDRGFCVFRNSDTNEVNVIYNRRDGNYGLIEPSF